MSKEPVIACIALGANLGDRARSMDEALARLGSLPHTTLLRASSPVETDPVGPVPQPRYLNAAAMIRTSLSARELLNAMLEIERSLGRDRASEQRWGPRTIDLDLLLYGDAVIDEPGLTVPHSRMHERLFVLIPLGQIAPERPIPTLQLTIAQLRDSLLAGTSGTAPGSN